MTPRFGVQASAGMKLPPTEMRKLRGSVIRHRSAHFPPQKSSVAAAYFVK